MSRRARVLWLGESPLLATGFGRVTKELTKRFARDPSIELACLGWSYKGWPYNRSEYPFPIYPGDASLFGKDTLEDVVQEFQPDILISLGELWMVEWIKSHPTRERFKWVAYIPIDSGPLYPPTEPLLRNIDEIVLMSHFGEKVIQECLPAKRLHVIPHGVDPSVFRPLESKRHLKNHERFRNKFVVGCVARNQPRKNIPALIKAFSLLLPRYPDIHLCLHTSPHDVGHDLLTLLKRYHLEGNADISSPELNLEHALSDEQLNRLYNLFDITVLPSMAEGFGLPIIESMAAGVPVVATDYGACSELVVGRGELVKAAAMLTMGTNLMEQAIIDVEQLANRIESLYLNRDLLALYAEQSRIFAETLSWDRLFPKWIELIRAACGGSLQRKDGRTSSPVNSI